MTNTELQEILELVTHKSQEQAIELAKLKMDLVKVKQQLSNANNTLKAYRATQIHQSI